MFINYKLKLAIFAGINFCQWSLKKNFLGINFHISRKLVPAKIYILGIVQILHNAKLLNNNIL